MIIQEYLLSYGTTGEFGRFRPLRPLTCRRGDRVVLRSHRGVELGVLLCPATPDHARFLPNTTVGQLLRLATPEDEVQAQDMLERSRHLFADCRTLAAELTLPLEVLDVEVLLDGEHAILHHVHWADFDERPLVSALSRRHSLHIRLHTLRTAPAAHQHDEEEGCGRQNCGQRSGGCGSEGSCGSGEGCSSCGAARHRDMEAYFAQLREKMQQHNRVPLL